MELGNSPADLEVDVAPAAEPLRGWLTSLNSVLSRLTMYVACLCLAGLLTVSCDAGGPVSGRRGPWDGQQRLPWTSDHANQLRT